MGIPIEPSEEKPAPNFSLDGEDHPMIHGMQPGKVYHMKIKVKMTGKNIHKMGGKETHSGMFDILHLKEHGGDQSISEIMKDAADEGEPVKHEKSESKHKESQEDGE